MTDEAPTAVGRALPTGTVTFLRTDVEGSMGLTRDLGPAWDAINVTHLGIIRRAVADHGGIVVRTEGDAVFAVFPEARAAVAAAIDAQRALAAHEWPDGLDLRVRMGLHSGEAHMAGDDYGGFEVNRAARIAAVGHGGQILLSEPTRALAIDGLPDGVATRDLGTYALKDVPRPERLFQLDVADLRAEFPPLRTATSGVGDLPVRRTSFIGREGDLDAIASLLTMGSRLVTLTGPGGIGKTSLAVEAARRVADRFPDGAWFVGLADVEDAATVRPVIARTIGLFDGPSRPAAEALAPYLMDRSTLLVVDNFEHLLDAAGVIAEILDASTRSTVLVTSRAALRIAGEQEYPLDPLGDACAGLFVERARSTRPSWDPGADRAVVDEICTLVDRLPLGVELAAARVAHLPPTAIRDRLAAHIPLPGPGPRGVPDRQRTLTGAIAWSHDLLSPGSQRVLHDLAVFEGGFDLDQAEPVVEPGDGADVLDLLVSLVDQSLVQREVPDTGGNGIRFRLLETIRGFALERLRAEGREEAARRRHAVAYLGLAEEAAPNLPGTDQPRWLDRLAIDYPNLRAAIHWAIDMREVDIAQRFIAAIWRFWQQDGRLVDATEFAEEVLTMPGSDVPTSARLAAVTAAGNIAYWHGRPTDAVGHYQEELALARQLGDVAAEADAWWNLSFEHWIADDIKSALETTDRARRLFEQVGDERGAARLEWSAVTAASGDQPDPESKETLLALLDRFERLGDVWFAGQTMMSIAWVSFADGDLAGASRWFIRAFSMAHAYRDVTSTTIAIPLGALLAVMAGRGEDAARLLGASEHLSELYGVRAPLGLSQLLDASDPRQSAEEMIGPERYAEAFEDGARMSLDEAVALVVRIQDETWGPG